MEQTMEGSLANPSHRLPAPPPLLYAMPRSKTGRKPQRSSPLAGPAVSVDDSEGAPSRLRVSSSPSLNRDFNNSLLSPTPRQIISSRPKTMDSTHSLRPQSFTPQGRSYESLPGTKQLIRPVSAVLPLTATRFSNRDSSRPQTAGNLGEHTYYNHSPPLSPTTKRPATAPSPSKPLELPTIILNDSPQIPPPPPPKSPVTTDNSWYTANAYEETPRFSRLAAGGVIMPVSAKEYNRSSGNRSLCDLTSVNSANVSTTNSGGNRRSFLMDSLTSTLKMTRSNPNLASSDHQEPSPSSSFSSRSSDSSPAPSATSTFSPASSLYRTKSFTDSLASSTFTSSSRTSVNEEMTQESSSPTIVHGMGIQKAEMPSIVGKDRSKGILVSDKSRRGGTFKRFMRLFVTS